MNEYIVKSDEKALEVPKTVKYSIYDKLRGGKASKLKKKHAAKSPRMPKKDKSKLAQSLKKLTESGKKAEEDPSAKSAAESASGAGNSSSKAAAYKTPGKDKKRVNGLALVNKSYDTILNDKTMLPQIDSKRVKHVSNQKSTSKAKPANTDLIKENEELKIRNRELLSRISELEKIHSSLKGESKPAKLLFDYERKVAGMELSLQSSQIKLQENDKLITQLLKTIDYLNQAGASPTSKESRSAKSATGEKADSESGQQQFLFNKSELVQSHTQIKQTKYMIFEGFKTLQAEITKKYGDQGRIIGSVDYLLGNLDGLFNIIHQLEIKELQYLNLLANNQPQQSTLHDKSPAKAHK